MSLSKGPGGVHGNKYDYSKVQYTTNSGKVCIICPEHGEFWQRASAHLSGNGCPVCWSLDRGRKRRTTQEEFIKKANKIHKNKYNYDKVQYVTAIKPVTINCPLHGDFQQTPHKHLQGHGCPVCGAKNNLTEIRFIDSLRNIFGNVVYQQTYPFLKDKSGIQKIDFYLPEYNIGIELNGRQHYVPVEKFGGEYGLQLTKIRDLKKYERCKNHGIKLFYYTPPTMKSYIRDYFDKVYTSFEELINDIKNYNDQ